MLNSRAQVCVDRHSHSLDDVRLFPPPAPLGTTLPPDSSHSYTFGLPDASANTKTPTDHDYYPLLHCQAKPSFYGRRSTNCLSLDLLGDEQFLEFILWLHYAQMSTNLPLVHVQCNSNQRFPTYECLCFLCGDDNNEGCVRFTLQRDIKNDGTPHFSSMFTIFLESCGLDNRSNPATFQSENRAYLLMLLYIVYILLALFYCSSTSPSKNVISFIVFQGHPVSCCIGYSWLFIIQPIC